MTTLMGNTDLAKIIDQIVAHHPEGITKAELREAAMPAVQEFVARNHVPNAQLVGSLYDALSTPIFRDRTKALSKSLETLAEYLTGKTKDIGDLEDRMNQAYTTGSDRGRQVLLKYWLIDDLNEAVEAREQNAQSALIAAEKFAERADIIRGEMFSRGAHRIGDLLRNQSEEVA